MKRFATTLTALFLALAVFAQAEQVNFGKIEIYEDEGHSYVTVAGDVSITELQDTTKIKLGKKGVTIIEDEDGNSSVTWENLDEVEDPDDYNDLSDECDDGEKSDSKKKFKGHWAGFELGLNNYVNDDYSMVVEPDFMDLNTGKSWNYNLNILQQDLTLGTPMLGLVTGLGFEFSNYHFDNGNVIQKTAGVIDEYSVGFPTEKSRLQTIYLNAPLLLEFQVPGGSKKGFFVSGGVIGGVKLASKTKMVYFENGDKKKFKEKDDFNLNALRYGFTARIGFRSLRLYATYYPMSLFETGKGPVGGDNLYPFAVGLSLIDF